MNTIKRKLNILKKRKIDKRLDNFFNWIKGAELVELKLCNTTEDPVRPELDIVFRRSYGRKIFGVKYQKEICAIMCFGFTDEIPRTVKELDLMTRDAYLKSAQRDQNIGQVAVKLISSKIFSIIVCNLLAPIFSTVALTSEAILAIASMPSSENSS